MERIIGAIFMKLGRAPATSIIFKKESLWIGMESITTTGNYFRCAGVEVSLWLEPSYPSDGMDSFHEWK
jgi:hypothetical protein